VSESEHLSLYKFAGCPYCSRVETAIQDLELDIERRDVRQSADHANALREATGRPTVPVLRTDNGDDTQWLPESADIVRHLYAVYGNGKQPSLFASPMVPLAGKALAIALFAGGVLSTGANQLWLFLAAVAAWVLGVYAPLLRRLF